MHYLHYKKEIYVKKTYRRGIISGGIKEIVSVLRQKNKGK